MNVNQIFSYRGLIRMDMFNVSATKLTMGGINEN